MFLNIVYVLFCYFGLSIWMLCICDVSVICIPFASFGLVLLIHMLVFLVIWYLDLTVYQIEVLGYTVSSAPKS
jgi:hypothetical protein